jgi:hypothetical protein
MYVGYMRDLGLEVQVASLLDGLGELRGSRPSQQSPNLPCAAALQHWEEFETKWLPEYIAARTQAAEIQSGHLRD